MRILVDEDLASKELITRLRKAGHHVETFEKGAPDTEVWHRAQVGQLVVLTGDPKGFLSLASTEHNGLMVVHGERVLMKQMRTEDIADAVEHVRAVRGEALRGERIVLNQWRRARANA